MQATDISRRGRYAAICGIEHRWIAPERLAEIQRLLVKSNAVIKSHRETVERAIRRLVEINRDKFGGDCIGELLTRLFLPAKHIDRINPARLGIADLEAEFGCLRGLPIRGTSVRDNVVGRTQFRALLVQNPGAVPAPVLAAIARVESVEEEMVAGFVRQIAELAIRLDHRTHACSDADDLGSVGIFGVREAIWGYERDEIKFQTYVWWAIFRRMVREITRTRETGKLSAGNERLVALYYKAMLDAPEDAGFDDVVARIRIKEESGRRPLTEFEVDTLACILNTHVRVESDLGIDEDGFSPIQGIPDAFAEDASEEAVDIAERMRLANLTDPERELVEMVLLIGRGASTRWAEKHGYSRRGATLVFRRILKKLKTKVA